MTEKFIIFEGRKFYPPYQCFCCGKEISEHQFCWGRLCAYCDCGGCCKNWVYEKGHNRKDIFENAEKLGDEFQELIKSKLKKIEDEHKNKNKKNLK